MENKNINKASYKSLLVIIPALNEGQTIRAVIDKIHQCADRLVQMNVQLKVCVVDDGSSDNTLEEARQARVDHFLVHRINQGVGAAVRRGLGYGRDKEFDVLVKLDGDGQHEPSDIPDLIQPILEGQADIVYGNRFPRISYQMPLIRRMGNNFFRGLMRWLVHWDIKDSQPGIFAVNRSYLKVFFLPGDYNYTQQILLDSYIKGMTFTQVPVSFNKRKGGTSFISLKYPFLVLPQILMLFVMLKPLKFFIPIAAMFVIIAMALFVLEISMWICGSTTKPIEHVNLVLGLVILGINTGFFGLLAELVIQRTKHDTNQC